MVALGEHVCNEAPVAHGLTVYARQMDVCLHESISLLLQISVVISGLVFWRCFVVVSSVSRLLSKLEACESDNFLDLIIELYIHICTYIYIHIKLQSQ